MKTSIKIPANSLNPVKKALALQEKAGKNNFFVYALELILLYMMVFASFSAFAQEGSKEPGKLEFAKQTAVFNSVALHFENSKSCFNRGDIHRREGGDALLVPSLSSG